MTDYVTLLPVVHILYLRMIGCLIISEPNDRVFSE